MRDKMTSTANGWPCVYQSLRQKLSRSRADILRAEAGSSSTIASYVWRSSERSPKKVFACYQLELSGFAQINYVFSKVDE